MLELMIDWYCLKIRFFYVTSSIGTLKSYLNVIFFYISLSYFTFSFCYIPEYIHH